MGSAVCRYDQRDRIKRSGAGAGMYAGLLRPGLRGQRKFLVGQDLWTVVNRCAQAFEQGLLAWNVVVGIVIPVVGLFALTLI